MAETAAEATAADETSARAEEHSPEERPRAEDYFEYDSAGPQVSMASAAESTVMRNIPKTDSITAVQVLVTVAIVSAVRTPKSTMAAALQDRNDRGTQGRRQTYHHHSAKQRVLMRTNFLKGRPNYRSRPAPEAHNGWRQQRRMRQPQGKSSPNCASITRVDPVG